MFQFVCLRIWFSPSRVSASSYCVFIAYNLQVILVTNSIGSQQLKTFPHYYLYTGESCFGRFCQLNEKVDSDLTTLFSGDVKISDFVEDQHQNLNNCTVPLCEKLGLTGLFVTVIFLHGLI